MTTQEQSAEGTLVPSSQYVFKYFDAILRQHLVSGTPLDWWGPQGDLWSNKRVLEFGGGYGRMLRDFECSLLPENYHCLDVSEAKLRGGEADFPSAHWHYYNRYNLGHNFTGDRNEPLPESITSQKFDIIAIPSVFTQTSVEEMERTINRELMPLLNPGGVLMCSYMSLNNLRLIRSFLTSQLGSQELLKLQVISKFRGRHFGYLVGKAKVLGTENELDAITQAQAMKCLCSDRFIGMLFPDSVIHLPHGNGHSTTWPHLPCFVLEAHY